MKHNNNVIDDRRVFFDEKKDEGEKNFSKASCLQ